MSQVRLSLLPPLSFPVLKQWSIDLQFHVPVKAWGWICTKEELNQILDFLLLSFFFFSFLGWLIIGDIISVKTFEHFGEKEDFYIIHSLVRNKINWKSLLTLIVMMTASQKFTHRFSFRSGGDKPAPFSWRLLFPHFHPWHFHGKREGEAGQRRCTCMSSILKMKRHKSYTVLTQIWVTSPQSFHIMSGKFFQSTFFLFFFFLHLLMKLNLLTDCFPNAFKWGGKKNENEIWE